MQQPTPSHPCSFPHFFGGAEYVAWWLCLGVSHLYTQKNQGGRIQIQSTNANHQISKWCLIHFFLDFGHGTKHVGKAGQTCCGSSFGVALTLTTGCPGKTRKTPTPICALFRAWANLLLALHSAAARTALAPCQCRPTLHNQTRPTKIESGHPIV